MQNSMAEMLINQKCPFGYQCKDVNCMECIEISREEKHEAD